VARVPVALAGERESAILVYLCVQRSELEEDGAPRMRLVDAVRRFWPEVALRRRLPCDRYINRLGKELRDAGVLRAVYLDDLGVLAHMTVRPDELPDPRQMELPLQSVPRRRSPSATEDLNGPTGPEGARRIRSSRTESGPRALSGPTVRARVDPDLPDPDPIESIRCAEAEEEAGARPGPEKEGNKGKGGTEQKYPPEELRAWRVEMCRRREFWDDLFLPLEAHRLPLEVCFKHLDGRGEKDRHTGKVYGLLYPTKEARDRAAGRAPAQTPPPDLGAGLARDAELLKEAPAAVDVGELLARLRSKLTPGGPSAAA
jgi:hypothetical protein